MYRNLIACFFLILSPIMAQETILVTPAFEGGLGEAGLELTPEGHDFSREISKATIDLLIPYLLDRFEENCQDVARKIAPAVKKKADEFLQKRGITVKIPQKVVTEALTGSCTVLAGTVGCVAGVYDIPDSDVILGSITPQQRVCAFIKHLPRELGKLLDTSDRPTTWQMNAEGPQWYLVEIGTDYFSDAPLVMDPGKVKPVHRFTLIRKAGEETVTIDPESLRVASDKAKEQARLENEWIESLKRSAANEKARQDLLQQIEEQEYRREAARERAERKLLREQLDSELKLADSQLSELQKKFAEESDQSSQESRKRAGELTQQIEEAKARRQKQLDILRKLTQQEEENKDPKDNQSNDPAGEKQRQPEGAVGGDKSQGSPVTEDKKPDKPREVKLIRTKERLPALPKPVKPKANSSPPIQLPKVPGGQPIRIRFLPPEPGPEISPPK